MANVGSFPVYPASKQVQVRPLRDLGEMQACVELQQRIWGYSDLQTVPDQMFVVAAKSGGHVLGAFDGKVPIGFALAFAGFRDGRHYLHSHMVAVLPEYQNAGIGRALKLAQRKDAVERGLDCIEWTFDPLQVKNAHFNIMRLGAIVRHYLPDLYGRTSSPLHGGLPTDRLVAEWWIATPRVTQALTGQLAPIYGERRIAVPSNIAEICKLDYARAEETQSNVRLQFEQAFQLGYAVTGFQLNDDAGSYLLEMPPNGSAR